jgi:hypothetical protein
MLKFYFKLPLKLKMGVVGVEMDMCHLDKIKLEEEEELEQNMQKCRQIADALILRSPYIGLKFTRMIKDQPTGQAFLMEGIFNDSPVAVKLFLDDSKRNEIDILRALASTPPCEYLVRKLSHCNEPTPCIIFPLLHFLKEYCKQQTKRLPAACSPGDARSQDAVRHCSWKQRSCMHQRIRQLSRRRTDLKST